MSWSTPEYPKSRAWLVLALCLSLLYQTRGTPWGQRWLNMIARYQLNNGGRPQLADEHGSSSQRVAARALRSSTLVSVLVAVLHSVSFIAVGYWGDAKPGKF
jgi:hypothetical protein